MQNYSGAAECLSFFRVLVPTVDRNALNSELMVAGRREKGCGEGIVREFGMDMYTLLYLKWITNEGFLYSPWNSAKCCVAGWMGGEFGGEWIHVYAWLSPFAVHWKLSHC